MNEAEKELEQLYNRFKVNGVNDARYFLNTRSSKMIRCVDENTKNILNEAKNIYFKPRTRAKRGRTYR